MTGDNIQPQIILEAIDGIPIPWATRYYATRNGRVYSTRTNAFISSSGDKNGYLRVFLVGDDGKGKTYKTHRVILATFSPIENMDSLQVNHKDGDKTNNNVDNLEWVTTKENVHHAFAIGLRTKTKPGLQNKCSSLGAEALETIFNLRLKGVTKKEIADILGVRPSVVVSVLLGARYREDFSPYMEKLVALGIEKHRTYNNHRVVR